MTEEQLKEVMTTIILTLHPFHPIMAIGILISIAAEMLESTDDLFKKNVLEVSVNTLREAAVTKADHLVN